MDARHLLGRRALPHDSTAQPESDDRALILKAAYCGDGSAPLQSGNSVGLTAGSLQQAVQRIALKNSASPVKYSGAFIAAGTVNNPSSSRILSRSENRIVLPEKSISIVFTSSG
jgi:hypothetical protein